ncbi:Uncharacterized [Moorella glycerini]|uniref:Uncharacterized protein n=1 Tax=Neomoorella stamsii TaxID=1266720 RepID=A0A9X7P6Q7_9FIRM|nr:MULTISPECIES: hypothetical protein [Moorella]PRR74559.1 hypothetical protein MOST_09940 [Moorella stamsii]CEP69154.1 Uncharacterized [Moorella glycerini]
MVVEFIKVAYDWHQAARQVLAAGLSERTAEWIRFGKLPKKLKIVH